MKSEHNGCHVDRVESQSGRRALDRAERRHLEIEGMGCPACAARVHNALVSLSGVLAADVNHESSRVEVWLDAPVSTQALIDAVGAAGERTNHRYLAHDPSLRRPEPQGEYSRR